MHYDRVREKEIRGGCRTDTRDHRHNLFGHLVLPDSECSMFILYREPTSSDFMSRSPQNITSRTVQYAARADTRIIACQPCHRRGEVIACFRQGGIDLRRIHECRFPWRLE